MTTTTPHYTAHTGARTQVTAAAAAAVTAATAVCCTAQRICMNKYFDCMIVHLPCRTRLRQCYFHIAVLSFCVSRSLALLFIARLFLRAPVHTHTLFNYVPLCSLYGRGLFLLTFFWTFPPQIHSINVLRLFEKVSLSLYLCSLSLSFPVIISSEMVVL